MEEKKSHTGLWVLIVILLCAGMGYLGYMVGKGKIDVPGLTKDETTTKSVEKEEPTTEPVISDSEFKLNLNRDGYNTSIQILDNNNKVVYNSKLYIDQYFNYIDNFKLSDIDNWTIESETVNATLTTIPSDKYVYYVLKYGYSLISSYSYKVLYYDGEKIIELEDLSELTAVVYTEKSTEKEYPIFKIEKDSIIFVNVGYVDFAKNYGTGKEDNNIFALVKMTLNKDKYTLEKIDEIELKAAGQMP